VIKIEPFRPNRRLY